MDGPDDRYTGVLTRDPRSVADAADAAAVDDRRAQAVDALPPTLLTGALVLAGVAPVHHLLEPGRASTVVAVVCGALAVLFAAARWSLRLPRVRGVVVRYPHETLLVVCVLASVGAAIELVSFGRPTSAGGLVVFLLAAGVLTTRRRDALVVSAAVVVQWSAVAAAHGFSGAWAPLTVLVVCAAVLAHVLQVVRSRATDHLARAEVMVLEAAVTDELTGLRNRRGLVGAGEAMLRQRPGEPLSVVFLDVDGLKRTNDELGHAAGDRLVQAAATVLLATARTEDVVARIGGDEFAVLLPGTDEDAARGVRERVARALEDAGVPASLGSTTTDGRRSASLPAVLDAADAAMYADKERRRAAAPPLPRRAPAAGPTTSGARTTASLPGASDADGGSGAAHAVLAPAGVGTTAALDLLGIARATAWLHVALVPVHLVVLPDGPGRLMAAGSLAVAVLAAVLLLRTWRAAVSRQAGPLLCAVMVVLCAETVGYSALVPDRWASMATVLALVAAGGTLAGGCRARVRRHDRGLAGPRAARRDRRRDPRLRDPGGQRPRRGRPAPPGPPPHPGEARGRRGPRPGRGADGRAHRAAEPSRVPRPRPPARRALAAARRAGLRAPARPGRAQARQRRAGARRRRPAAGLGRRRAAPQRRAARRARAPGRRRVHRPAPRLPPDELPARTAWLETALAEEGISASIGAACLPRDARTLDGLVDRADEAMLVVKHRRRDRRAGRVPVG